MYWLGINDAKDVKLKLCFYHLYSVRLCPFVTLACTVEACGLLADCYIIQANNYLEIRLDCCVPLRCCRLMVVSTKGGDFCLYYDREILLETCETGG
jgi:hypothetical protein